MSCPTSEILSQYHDGELPEARALEIERHLATCLECQAELTDFGRLSFAFSDAPVMRLSTDARDRILESLGTPSWVRLVLPVARPFAAAAVILMAIGLPVLLSSESGSGAAEVKSSPASWASSWEVTAIARETDPTTGTTSGQPDSAAQFASWVVADLSAGRRR